MDFEKPNTYLWGSCRALVRVCLCTATVFEGRRMSRGSLGRLKGRGLGWGLPGHPQSGPWGWAKKTGGPEWSASSADAADLLDYNLKFTHFLMKCSCVPSREKQCVGGIDQLFLTTPSEYRHRASLIAVKHQLTFKFERSARVKKLPFDIVDWSLK